jgi:hypothetical protein
MDCWIVALRGTEDALVEARSVLGTPSNWLDSLEAYLFETLRPADAAERIAKLMPIVLRGLSGAVAVEGDGALTARQQATALACAAADGELLVTRAARERLEPELVLVRPIAREHWVLPCPAFSVAPRAAERAACRESVGRLNTRPALVARQREIAALKNAVGRSSPVLVRAVPGAGAARVIEEAAQRAGTTAFFLPAIALQGSASNLERALEPCPANAWVVADPLPDAQAAAFAKISEKFAAKRPFVIRVAPSTEFASKVPLEGITVGPLRDYDARALVRTVLGRVRDPSVDRLLARKGSFLPGKVMHAVQSAVQLGTLVHDGEAWGWRARRALKTVGRSEDVIAARIDDLPPALQQAIGAINSLGDGRSAATALALFRGLFGADPEPLLDSLVSLALVHKFGDRLRMDHSVRLALGEPPARAVALQTSGAISHAAQGERHRSADRGREAALYFASAAREAMTHKLSVAALRYLVLAKREAEHPEVAAILKNVLGQIGPAVTVDVIGTRPRMSRPRVMDPEQLETAAAQLDERDREGAARLRTLAELMRGNSQRARQLADVEINDGSSKMLLTAALAQAASGDSATAVRSAISALAVARSKGDNHGQIAALSFLAAIYRALGRDENAVTLTDAARKLLPPPATAAPSGA